MIIKDYGLDLHILSALALVSRRINFMISLRSSVQMMLLRGFCIMICDFCVTSRSYVIKQEETQKHLGIDDPKGYLEDNQYLAEKGKDLSRDFVARYLRTALPSLPEEGIQ